MALSRKFLSALGVEAEKIDEIITAHTESLSAIKEERDGYKAQAEKLADVEKALADATKELETFKTGDWEKKYNEIKSQYESYKSDTEKKAVQLAKENAYKQLLLDAGVSDKRIATVLKVSDMGTVELDEEGKIKDADKLTESVKKEWADFIVKKQEEGANTPNPPANDGNNGNDQPSHAAQLAAKYRNEHYGVPTEN